MSHHNKDLNCPSCADKLKTANPELAKIYIELIKPHYTDCHIAWAYRGKDDQDKAFMSHKSKCIYPNSPHNKTDKDGNPCSLAIDVFRIDENGVAIFPVSYYHDIYEFLQSQNSPVAWGGNFHTLADFDHFELIIN